LLGSQHDVLLLDINMHGRSGMEVLKDVKHIYPQLPVIMVSVQPENQYASRCLRAGATAYINKNSASEELVPTIKKILDNGAKSVQP
jgi:DNA-binding NarL/FixJ family response regulator